MTEDEIIAAREGRLKTLPKVMRGLYQRAWDGKSRRDAIRAFCVGECMGGNRAEVARCTSPGCPLYEFRGAR